MLSQEHLIIKDKALGEELHSNNSKQRNIRANGFFLSFKRNQTLHLRVQRHCENGEKVAEYLNNHPLVERVYYLGLASHPFHEIIKSK